MDEKLADAVSAASLVLAVLAALYTLWLPAVNAALGIVPDPDKDNRAGQKSEILGALLTKALPLSIASVTASAILFCRASTIVVEAWRHHGVWVYDDVKALLLLTYVLLLLLALVACRQLIELRAKQRQLDS